MSQDTPDIVEPDWATRDFQTLLMRIRRRNPMVLHLYLNFMLPYNTDENGVINEAAYLIH